MKLIALTGLSKESLEDLAKRGIRTFEFRSSHNVMAFSDIRPGDTVFLTDVVPVDMTAGQCGLMVKVRSVEVMMHRQTYGSASYIEEIETMSARVQLSLVSQGKIKSVTPIEMYKPISVEAMEIKSCAAR